MAVYYKLLKNNIKSSKNYGKYYAHTVKQGELTMEQIERQIEANCTAKASDVRVVLKELVNVVNDGLKNGKVVNLGELGKFYLSIQSECVDSPDAFSVGRHVKGLKCRFTPFGERKGRGDHRIERDCTRDCVVMKQPLNDVD